MKRVLLIAQVFLWDDGDGVSQKFFSQAKAFTKLGACVDCIGYDQDRILLCAFADSGYSLRQVLGHFETPKLKRFSFWNSVSRYIRQADYDLVYIRYPSLDFSFLSTLRHLRKHCRRVVMEVPSFPLVHPRAGFFSSVQFWLDRLLQPKCKHYMDRILYIGNPVQSVFGCPSVLIPNGIPERIRSLPSTGFSHCVDAVDMICVSNMYPAHGYDRLIHGLGEYYSHHPSPRKVNLIMVGDGPCRHNYEALADTYHVTDHIRFMGPLRGDALTAAYRSAVVGLGSLAVFRKGYTASSSLKTKEYLIRGLPFVYAGTEIGLDADFPFAFQIPNDEQPVSIEAILDFVDSYSSLSSETVAAQMRSYAEEHFSWETILLNACGEYLSE